MTLFRSNIPDLMDISFRKILFNKYNTLPMKFGQIFNVESSTKKEEKDSSLSNFGLAVAKSEGVPITYDDPLQGYDVTYTHVTYGLGFRVTEEAMEDDQFRKIKKLPAGLARSLNQTVETVSANIFNNAFSSGTGGDGLYLCHTAHTLTGGGTYRNKPDTDADLTETSLQTAINSMEATTDDRGIILAIKPKILLVPPELKWQARVLLKSDQKPESDYNDYNALMDDGLNYVVWDYLTDDDAWFLLANKDQHELNFFWRRKIATESGMDFDTGDLKFKATMRFSVKWSDWRGVYGTSGGA